jgi:hypothetical protein
MEVRNGVAPQDRAWHAEWSTDVLMMYQRIDEADATYPAPMRQ